MGSDVVRESEYALARAESEFRRNVRVVGRRAAAVEFRTYVARIRRVLASSGAGE